MEEKNYSFNIRFSFEDEGYIATCPEFPGLSAFGETEEEALKEARVALEGFIESYSDSNKELPEPIHVKRFSGQLRLRLPKSLHGTLSEIADSEGVSLNTFLIQCIQDGLTKKTINNELRAILESNLNKRERRDVTSSIT